jgi:hypothetical protein
VLARLGHVLYWIGCIVAVVVLLAGAAAWLAPGPPAFMVLGAIAAVIAWLIGRACRYVLSGT